MKSISLAVGDATLAKAEKVASQKKTSVAGLLRRYLHQLTSTPATPEGARRRLLRLSVAARGEVGPRTWTRGDLYDR